MADNVAITAGSGTNIATDDVGGIQHQRVKVEYGGDGSATDVSLTTPLPAGVPATTTSGSITATDAVVGAPAGAGVPVSGTPTTNSTLVMALTGSESAVVFFMPQTTWGGGTVWFEATQDSTNGVDGNWTTISCRLLGTTGSTVVDGATAGGEYRGNCAGMKYVRLRITGATTPSLSGCVIRATGGVGTIALNAPLPAGTNAIGIADSRGTPLVSTSGAIAAAATGTVGPLDVSRQGNVSFFLKNTVAASAWAGAPVVVFEQSDDNTSWAPLIVVNNATGEAKSTWVLGVNAANTEMVFEAGVEAVNYVRARVTTGPSTNGMTINIQAGSLPFVPVVTTIERENANRTQVALYIQGTTAGATTTERIETVTISRGTAATSTGTTFAITSGKKFRITGIRFSHVGHATATTAAVVWRIRMNTSGAAIVTSTPIIFSITTRTPATSLARDAFDVPVGTGYEIDNTAGGIQIGITSQPTFTTNAPTFDVAIVGFEY